MKTKDYASELAIFLLDKTGSIFGSWTGTLTRDEQLALFGLNLGSREITIYGEMETVSTTTLTGFGLLVEETITFTWAELMAYAAA